MTLQHGVEFEEYFRCYVVGQEKVHIMRYDPRAPHHERYVKGNPPAAPALMERVEKDALTLCRALGYDLNTVEFAVEDGVPYAIDFMNPAPDADVNSVGQQNFDWIVDAVAEMAMQKAQCEENPTQEAHITQYLDECAGLNRYSGLYPRTCRTLTYRESGTCRSNSQRPQNSLQNCVICASYAALSFAIIVARGG